MMTQKQLDAMLSAVTSDGKGPIRPFWKPKGKEEGEWQMRLLMPLFENSEKMPYFRHQIHYVNGKGYECLNQSLTDSEGNFHKAERCPFCEEKEKLYRQGEKGSEEWTIAGKLKARNLYDYRGIVRSDEDNPKEVKIIRIPNGVHEELMGKLLSGRHGNIFDFAEGRDVVLIKKGTGLGSAYSHDLVDKSPIFTDPQDLKTLVKEMKEVSYSKSVTFATFEDCKRELSIFLGEDDEIIEVLKNQVSFQGLPEKTVTSIPETEPEIKMEEEDINDLFDKL